MGIKNYHLFDVADFVADEDFMLWVNEPNAANEAFWRNWLAENPGKNLAVAEARQILQSIRFVPAPVSNRVVAQETERLLQTINTQQQKVHSIFQWHTWKFAAACFIVLAGLGLMAFYYAANESDAARFDYANVTASKHLLEQVNTSGKPMKIELTDGSTVTLMPNSRISYPNGFERTDTRDVYLSGEAFFEVSKDALHPFRVFANAIITKVLGTSFTVSAFDKEKNIEVTVRTGKVGVYSQRITKDKKTEAANRLDGIIITPNQQLSYEKTQQKFEKEILDKPVIIAPDITPQSMIYEDAPLLKIFKDLKKAYGIKIIYDASPLKNCTLTADLSDEALETKLNLICKAIGGSYEVIDAQVIIHAAGCP